jgi:signal transduction histidine kinase
MTKSFKVRLVLLVVMISLLAVVIGLAAHVTWQEVKVLEGRFKKVQVESSAIADQLQKSVLDLRGSLIKYAFQHQAEDLKSFQEQNQTLDDWIKFTRSRLSSQEEMALFEKIDRKYDEFQESATNALIEIESKPVLSGHYLALQTNIEASASLLDLGYNLADAHRAKMTEFLNSSRASFKLLQRVIFISLVFLLGIGVWLSFIVYREMIFPLRVKLVESEELIQRHEKLASLGLLAAGVAHEIRNPLTAIKARLFTLRRKLAPDSSERNDSEVIDQEISRLEKIVKDFLLFARPTEPNLELVSVRATLQEIHSLFAEDLKNRHITLQAGEIEDGLVRADPAQLKQVLLNLVQNAADAIPREGTITLRARLDVKRLHDRPTPVFILEVEDTGKGIAPEVVKRLFDPFFTTKETGTGLGLCIAARIVQKHAGALQYQTQVNRGTVFGIVLPRAEPNEK